MYRLLILVSLFFYSFAANAANVEDIKMSDTENFTSIIINFNSKPNYKVFTLENPARIVIDVENSLWNIRNSSFSSSKRVDSLRHSAKDGGSLRIVLDMKQPTILSKYYLNPQNNNSLIIELEPKNKILDEFALSLVPTEDKPGFVAPKPSLKERYKPLIVIDAGHGGHDPGSIGRRKTREKDITLKYSHALRKALLNTNRYRVYMTRSTDKYIQLRERVNKARRVKGDLFISVHADSHKNARTRGLSVYTLSETSSDKEAAALARKENKAGLINGLDLERQEDELSALFIDMTQRDTKNLSASFAETIVDSMENKVRLLRNPHRFAGFMVLKGIDIPSVLIELGYLSNRREEKLLLSEIHKKKLAKAIVKAIDNHFNKYDIE